MKRLQRGDMNVKDLITHRFPVQQAAQVYELLLGDRVEAMGVTFTYDEA